MRIAKPPVPSGAGELFYTLRSCPGLRLLQKKTLPGDFWFPGSFCFILFYIIFMPAALIRIPFLSWDT